jgi:hypothetical protein
MQYVDAEGSNNRDKQRLPLLNHRGQRVWHAYKGRIAEDGRSESFPLNTSGERLPGITKARLPEATAIVARQRYEGILQEKGIGDKGKPESTRRTSEVRASK